MPEDIRHPLFARSFDRLSRRMEPEIGPRRDELLAGLTGRVLEIGAGTGINFAHYPASVAEVVAVEPEPYLRAKAEEAALSNAVAVSVRPGVAEGLDLPSSSFDAAAASLVLCSVRSPQRVLRELARVLKPGGELRVFEHVRSDRPSKARLQRLADGSGIWARLGGGCHAARDTLAALRSAGFQVERADRFEIPPGWAITNPHILAVARPPSA